MRQDKNDEKSMRTPFELMHAFETGSGTAPGVIWVVPGRQLGIQDGQHGGQDGQLGGQDGPTCRREAVPSAFPRDLGATQNDPERPETAETSFSLIFHRFLSIFRLEDGHSDAAPMAHWPD